jgi:nucleolar protein 58
MFSRHQAAKLSSANRNFKKLAKKLAQEASDDEDVSDEDVSDEDVSDSDSDSDDEDSVETVVARRRAAKQAERAAKEAKRAERAAKKASKKHTFLN